MDVELKKLKVPANYNVEDIFLDDFHRCKDQHYLDHAAATLYSDSQIQRIATELQDNLFGNPHSRHTPSDTVTQIVDAVRQRILEHFNTTVQEYDVIFTSGATDALKIVAQYFIWNGTSDVLSNKKEIPNDVTRSVSEEEKPNKTSLNHGAFVYQRENHTSVLGIRECANSHGAEVHSITTKVLKELLDGKSVSSIGSQNNGCRNANCDSHLKCSGNDSRRKHCLFAYTAQCSFLGAKAPLDWIEKVQKGALNELVKQDPINKAHVKKKETQDEQADSCDSAWFVLLDAAGLVSTCPLDLSRWKPDFVPVSFYKIFGYPTGLGCLLVSHRAYDVLKKNYHGGGTVHLADSREMILIPRPVLHDRFEDGTLPYLNIIALRHGFDVISEHTGGMENIQRHVYHLARYTHHTLRSYRHANGKPVAELYLENGEWHVDTHGSIVNFNLLNSDGSYIGYSQVERMASLYNIHLRTGCLCNPGACQTYLDISREKLMQQFQAGHVCGDAHDLVDGYPTGSVRVSFGYMSTYKDADQLLAMISGCFVDGSLLIDSSWMSKEPLSSANVTSEPISVDHKSEDDKKEALQSKNLVNLTDFESEKPLELKSKESSKLKLTNINLYPVKSCGSLSVKKWKLVSEGLQFDHKWMVVTGSGVTLTQKRLPRLSLIRPSIDVEKNTLTLSYEGERDISIPLEVTPSSGEDEEIQLCGGRVCGDRVQGKDCGPEVGEWLSRVLDKPDLKLMRQTKARKGRRTPKTEGQVPESMSLANDSQYLVIHRASVRRLLADIHKSGSFDLSEDELVSRFRGNLIIDGGEPYEEDSWKSITIDKINFQVQGGCRRCQMVCIVPDTGERTKEPMLTLGNVRGSSMMFGVHAKALSVDDGKRDEHSDVITVGSVVEAVK